MMFGNVGVADLGLSTKGHKWHQISFPIEYIQNHWQSR